MYVDSFYMKQKYCTYLSENLEWSYIKTALRDIRVGQKILPKLCEIHIMQWKNPQFTRFNKKVGFSD